MRYPPAVTFTPRASWVYRGMALAVTIILIAAGAVFFPATSHFSSKNIVFLVLAAFAILWLLRDAWKRQKGSLHYAQGQWHLFHEDQEIAGTLRLHLDLQSYMLVSFTAHSAQYKLFQTTTQWFHLEARHADHAVSQAQAWGALRRAVYSPMEPTDEAVAA
jgi:hypothetical protein